MPFCEKPVLLATSFLSDARNWQILACEHTFLPNEEATTATPRLAFITLIATLAYLGLAILGFGGFAAFFSHPALTALAIATFVMSGISVFSGGNLSPGEREDRANRWVIAVFGLIGLLSGYLPAYTDRKDFWTLDGSPFAGLASSSLPSAALCGSGQSLCSAIGSAGW